MVDLSKIANIAKGLLDRLEDKYDISLETIVKGVHYLIKYGYLDTLEHLDKVTLADVVKAVFNFQATVGLKSDGELGPKTAKIMTYPRCEQKDIQLNKTSGYWRRKNLTYRIYGRDKDLSADIWDANIERALKQWSDVCGLKFTRTNGQANLNFGVGYRRSQNFDGPNGTLAWYQLPPRSNFTGSLDGKFDQSEHWLHWTEQQRGIYLLNVACHEIGHGIGLYHATGNRGNLMDPIYSARVAKPQSGDISRVVKLYDKPDRDEKPDPTPPPKKPDDGNFDGKEAVIRITGDITNIQVDGFRISPIG
jgi:hypothetical protein